jgi:hypothetical protein
VDVIKGIQGAQSTDGVGDYIAPDKIGSHQFPKDSGVSHDSRFISTTVKI